MASMGEVEVLMVLSFDKLERILLIIGDHLVS
jgi:hypothetical protein